jgi:hypothetical protein
MESTREGWEWDSPNLSEYGIRISRIISGIEFVDLSVLSWS